MEKWLKNIMPIMGLEHDCILSKQGDVTVAFKVELPEIFTLSELDFETFHNTWVKAIRILPKFTILHKQDWFIDSSFKPDFLQTSTKENVSFLNRASDRFFNERPFLNHSCYLFLTKKPAERKVSNSMFSNLIKPSLVPVEVLKPQMLQDFLDSTGQFKRILEDSGFVKLERLTAHELESQHRKVGLIERYFTLPETDQPEPSDIQFGEEIKIGEKVLQLYTLGDAADLPSMCSARTNYEKYSTDRTKFSIGFASTLGQLLSCNHIYNQFIFIDDAAKTLKKLEGKRLRLQSLSAYSRENTISRDSTNDFLNEAISEQRQAVKAHFNIQVWTQDKEELKQLKNQVSSALAQMDAVSKLETAGAAQIWWAAIPGNEADFPVNDTFDTFVEQAACFFNLETSYKNSPSPFGIRLGDRQTGRPIHVDLSDEPMRRGWISARNKFVLGPSGGDRAIFN